ncbi:MAG: vWA domain-containing protein [Polyangiaceae bacterium]
MRPLLIGSLFLLASPLCLTVACGSSGDSAGGDGGSSFGGSGGSSAGTSNGGSSGSSNGGSAGSSNGGTTNGGTSSGGTSSGGTSNGGSAGSSGNGGSGGSVEDAGIPDVNFTYDAPVIVEDACAATRIEADPVPVDMYIVLDKSGSMGTDCNVGSTTNSKWCHAVNALDGFFNDPSSVGSGVALGYFGATGCTTTSVSVALDNLPNHVAALRNSLNSTNPNDGSTNTLGALKGIVTNTTNLRRAGRQMIGILVTDGAPNGCSNSSNAELNAVVANHFAATGIPTFMIGMTGASFGNLELWTPNTGASPHTNYCGSGAGNPCLSYDVGNGDPLAFIDALKQIQKSAIGCTFNMPTPASGILDPNAVDVIYTPGSGSSQTLTRVTDQSQCGTAPGQGWYYDNNTTPTQIILCDDVCTTIQADQSAKIDVEIRCLGS